MYLLLELYELEKEKNKIHLEEICKYEFMYRNKPATVFQFSNGAKIIGYIIGVNFDLRVISLGENPKIKGYGQEMLRLLRPKFKTIYVNEIYEEALPFWKKMKERGLVDELASFKGFISNEEFQRDGSLDFQRDDSFDIMRFIKLT